MQRQRSFTTFEDHIAADKARLKAQVVCLGDSPEKDELLERIRQLEIASLALAVISTAKGLENSSTLIHHPPERWVAPVLHLDPAIKPARTMEAVTVLGDQSLQTHQAGCRNRSGPISPASKGAR